MTVDESSTKVVGTAQSNGFIIMDHDDAIKTPGDDRIVANGFDHCEEVEEDNKVDTAKASLPSFFEWQNSSHWHNGKTECDLCGQRFDLETDLKIHQLHLHINPVYLSDHDRKLGQVTCRQLNKQTSDGVGDLSRPFRGLFRCHVCFVVWNLPEELRSHLKEHNQDVVQEKRQSPTSQPSNGALNKKGKENNIIIDENAPLKGGNDKEDVECDSKLFQSKKMRISSSSNSSPKQLERPQEKENLIGQCSNVQTQTNVRPSRECKVNASTLVALSLEDEKFKFDFEEDSSVKRKRVSNSTVITNKKSGSVSHETANLESEGKSKTTRSAEEVSSQESKTISETGSECTLDPKPSEDANQKKLSLDQSKPDQDKDCITKRKRGRPRKYADSYVLQGEQCQVKSAQNQGEKSRKTKKKPQNKTMVSQVVSKGKKSKTKKKKKQTKSKKCGAQVSKMTSDNLRTDLKTKNPCQDHNRTSVQDATKVVANAVVEPENNFYCHSCTLSFHTYGDLVRHKQDNCSNPKKMLLSYTGKETKGFKEFLPWEESIYEFIHNSNRRVPEAAFNNMHGTLRDIGTSDGISFRSRDSVGTLEKVKLNISERWTTKDVWQSGGWETSKELLSWHKYDALGGRFLQRLSHLSWPQQHLFKKTFDHFVTSLSGGKDGSKYGNKGIEGSPTIQNRRSKRVNLPQVLNLKQIEKSVKYLSHAELENRKMHILRSSNKRKNFERKEENLEQVEMNGEWELEHKFLCSVCSETFDDLRDVMHHKWDAHPFCLVAHVTLGQNVQLPPSLTPLYPQLGRHLRSVEEVSSASKGEKRRRSRSSKYARKLKSSSDQDEKVLRKCSKCNEVSFESQSDFHKHVLVCGGDEHWDVTSKKKKKKKKKSKSNNNSGESTPRKEPSGESALKRKARFARFAQPPPRVFETGRMTRLQATLLEESKKKSKKRKNKKSHSVSKKKRTMEKWVTQTEDSANTKDDERKLEQRNVKTTNTPSRPRRSHVYYGRSNICNESDGNYHSQSMVPEPKTKTEIVVTGTRPQGAEFGGKVFKFANRKRRGSLGDEVGNAQKRRNCRLSLDSTDFCLMEDDRNTPVPPVSHMKKSWSNQHVDHASPLTPQKDLSHKPSDRSNVLETSEESDSSSVCSTSSSSNLSSLTSKRRSVRRNHLANEFINGNRRLLFPNEVKVDAIQRVLSGETKVDVARDLQCPVSTIASWWHKKDSLMQGVKKRKEEPIGKAEPEQIDKTSKAALKMQNNQEPQKNYPLVPYKRNELLLTMKRRIEEAFKLAEGEKEGNLKSLLSDELVEERSQGLEEVKASPVKDEDALKGDDKAETPVASGLSMILSNYEGIDDEEEGSDSS